MLKRALFVGIDKYNSKSKSIQNLQGCVSDMLLMKETIEKIVGHLPDHHKILIDNQATTKNILEALEFLIENLERGEKVFMYYAGHGGQTPNTIQTKDDPEEYDQILVPHDFSKTEPLLDDILRTYFSRIPEGSQFIAILDSCHSGGMARASMSSAEAELYRKEGWENRSIGIISRAEYSPSELRKLKKHKQKFMVERSENQLIMLAAAQPDELAWERYFGKKKHGIFTYHICEKLRESGIHSNPKELVDHAYKKILAYRENQMPRLIGSEKLFDQPLFDK